MEKIKKLVEIWKEIPKVESSLNKFDHQDKIKNYIDIFHIGEYFYLIFNTNSAKAEFVSDEIQKVLEIQPSEFNLELFFENMHPEDFEYYQHYEKSAVDFFSKLPAESFFNYKFSYDFRIKTGSGKIKRILQQIIPIQYFPEGGAKTLGIFTDITHLGITGIPKLSFIGMNGAPSFFNYHLTTDFHRIDRIFTKRENEILDQVIKGKKSEQIAKELNLSVYTIQTHRKNILRKSGCETLNELISTSIREGWV